MIPPIYSTPATTVYLEYFFTMFSNTQETPQPVKLRSSCDACGVGKVKCDRKHPACGRCVANGAVCVYGISRKIGKPPRKRVQSRSEDDEMRNPNGIRPTLHMPNSLASWNAEDGFSNPMDDFWDPMKDSGNTFGVHNRSQSQHKDTEMEDSDNKGGNLFDLDRFLSDSYNNLPGAIPNFNSHDFDGWKDNTFTSMEAVKPNLSSESTSGSQSGWPQSEAGETSPSASKSHDCYREAHDLLRRTSAATGSGTEAMAWDRLLLVNREASEQLRPLLRCECAGSPYLVMLYATIISAILSRYQHGINDTLCAPSNPNTPESMPGTSETDSNTIRTAPSGRSAVAPAKIVIGTFSVDDHRVQCALKIQLLASEVQKTVQLMDQFAAYNFDKRKSGEQNSGNDISGLHQSLNSWLQAEYFKISNMIKTRLAELVI